MVCGHQCIEVISGSTLVFNVAHIVVCVDCVPLERGEGGEGEGEGGRKGREEREGGKGGRGGKVGGGEGKLRGICFVRHIIATGHLKRKWPS